MCKWPILQNGPLDSDQENIKTDREVTPHRLPIIPRGRQTKSKFEVQTSSHFVSMNKHLKRRTVHPGISTVNDVAPHGKLHEHIPASKKDLLPQRQTNRLALIFYQFHITLIRNMPNERRSVKGFSEQTIQQCPV
jgi:hypothetical protein